MFIGISLFNIFNLLYNLFMVRYLSPINYGHLNSLLALFMVVSVPAATVQTTVTKFVSSFQAQNQLDRVKNLLYHILVVMLIFALSLFLLIFLGSSFISSFLQISSHSLILLLGVSLFFAMVTPVPWGGLQGLQKFGSLIINLIINGGLKFILGIIFIFLGFELLGAMGAIAIAYCITFILSLAMLLYYLPKTGALTHQGQNILRGNPAYLSEVYYYFFPVGIMLLCFMILTNIDLILVKHFFSPIEAGYYSIAQMIGKIILVLPLPIVMVMFPKLSSLKTNAQKEKGFSILGQSLKMASLLCIAATAICFFFPSFIIQVISGKVYLECIPLLRWFCINMTLFALNFILLFYHLSTQQRGFLHPLLFLSASQIVLIVLLHHSLVQVLCTVGAVAFCLLGVSFFIAFRPYRKV
jgi:O-antigen/teichoic acid export membrane protein